MILKNKTVIAIIPARFGSKRIKKKNLKSFCGKPLFLWTVLASKKSKLIDKVLVTSDSRKILSQAENAKVDFCQLRNKKLSSDKATSWNVVRDSLEFLRKKGYYFDYVAMLQPTSPLRSHIHIDNCLTKLGPQDTGMVSITESPKPIEWMAQLNKQKNFLSFSRGLKNNKFKKKKSYLINGAIYVFKTKEIYKKNFIFKKSVNLFFMDHKFSIDIDTQEEFKIAEFCKRFYKL
jgi:CMP-N,N'-diacetyllegionaminic acid synthase